MKKSILYYTLVIALTFSSCHTENTVNQPIVPDQAVVVLGIAQDAGYPQINCHKSCCQNSWQNDTEIYVSSLGVLDGDKYYIFDATPDFKDQINLVQNLKPAFKGNLPAGIFLTHAHIGHYTGLMDLGREATGADKVPVYVMPRMESFLSSNGPWNQLVKLENIDLSKLVADSTIVLNEHLSVIPLIVPHRDEYSETVGYKIIGKKKSVLFIPDIDKWSLWKRNIIDEIKSVDAAYIDATFYADGEIPGRNMADIPHPFVQETMDLFSNEDVKIRDKIRFIHLNHTNPIMNDSSRESSEVLRAGYHIARQSEIFELD